MTGLAWHKHRRQLAGDTGFSMIEVVFSLLIIAIVTTGSLAFFINNLRSVNGQGQRQQAVYLANQQLETIQSLPIAKLVTGRGSSAVSSLNATAAATKLKLNTQDDMANSANYDPTAAAAGLGNVKTVNTVAVSGTNYTVYSFINTCWYQVSSGLCGPTSGSGRTQEFRATVDVAWTSQGQCTGGCDYSTSTLIDPTANPQFNSNISTPAGSYTSVGSNNSPGLNPNINANSPLAETCTVNGTTVSGTKIVVNGTGLKAGIRVWISSGGGTISNIYQPVAGEVDFCYQTSDTPGAYTISIINTDGGHFQLPVTLVPSLSDVTGWNTTTRTASITGTGFEAGAVFTLSGGGATFGTTNSLVTGHTSTPGDSVNLANFVGPKDGGQTTLTVTNPDASVATIKITAPTVSSRTPTAIPLNTTKNITLVAPAGAPFQSTLTAVVAGGSGTATVTAVSATSATVSVKGTAVGTLSLYVYNDDGGFTSNFTITVDPLPTVTTFSPGTVTAGAATTITVNGSGGGFLPGMTASTTNGTVGAVTIVNSNQITMSVTASATKTDVITLTNLDGATTTFTLNVVPTITTFTPNPPAKNTTITWTVNGAGFSTGTLPTVTFTQNGAALTVSAITVNGAGTVLTFKAKTSSSGSTVPFVVTVTNPDGTSANRSQTMTPS